MYETGDSVVLLDDNREIIDFGTVVSMNDDVIVICSENNNGYVGYGLDSVDVLKYRLIEDETDEEYTSSNRVTNICSVLDIYNKYNKYTCY